MVRSILKTDNTAVDTVYPVYHRRKLNQFRGRPETILARPNNRRGKLGRVYRVSRLDPILESCFSLFHYVRIAITRSSRCASPNQLPLETDLLFHWNIEPKLQLVQARRIENYGRIERAESYGRSGLWCGVAPSCIIDRLRASSKAMLQATGQSRVSFTNRKPRFVETCNWTTVQSHRESVAVRCVIVRRETRNRSLQLCSCVDCSSFWLELGDDRKRVTINACYIAENSGNFDLRRAEQDHFCNMLQYV